MYLVVFGLFVAYNFYDRNRYIHYIVEFNLYGQDFDDLVLDCEYICNYSKKLSYLNSRISESNGKYFLFGIVSTSSMKNMWKNKQIKYLIENEFERHMEIQELTHEERDENLLINKSLEEALGYKAPNTLTTKEFITVLNKQTKKKKI